DTKKLKVKLLNYMHDLNRQDQTSERELEKLRLQSKVSAVFNNTNSNVNTTNMSINVSISSHINNSIRLTVNVRREEIRFSRKAKDSRVDNGFAIRTNKEG